MKRFFYVMVTIMVLAVAVQAGEDPVEKYGCSVGGDAARAKALVQRAAQYVADHGADEAVKAFHEQDGAFIDGDLYILFYGFDGTCLANGFKPELAGLNRYDVRDPKGVYQIREMIELAKGEGGWVHYRFESPTTKQLEPKATFVRRAPGMDAFVGCGIYGLPK